MSSAQETTKLPDDEEGGKESLVVSVRLPTSEDEKLVRRAAVELDQSRSAFMAEASVEKARKILSAEVA